MICLLPSAGRKDVCMVFMWPITTEWRPVWAHSTGKKIVETVREIGYNEVLSVEFSSPIDRTPANPYPNSIDENPEGLTTEHKKFLEDHGSTSVSEEFYAMLTKSSADYLLPLIK